MSNSGEGNEDRETEGLEGRWETEASSDPGTEITRWAQAFAGPVELDIDQGAPGPVLVTGTAAAEVQVRAVKSLRGLGLGAAEAGRIFEEAEIEVTVEGERVRIRTGQPRRWSFWGSDRVGIALEVKAPTGSSVRLDTGSGRTEVRGTDGPVSIDAGSGSVLVSRATRVDIDSGSGSVTVEEARGDVKIDSGSGPVSVERVHGRVEVDGGSGPIGLREVEGDVILGTGSGSVTLDRVIGDVSVDTGSGSVSLTATSARNITVDTGSGGIEADIDIHPSGRYSFDAGSGPIDLIVPENASFTLSADTGSGRVSCSVPLAISHSSRGSLEGVLGDGSASVSAETSSGGFSIRTRGGSGAAEAGPVVAAFSRGDPDDRHGRPHHRRHGGHGRPGRHADEHDAWAASISSKIREENRANVLKMIEEGRLSAEQGRDLLVALDGGPEGERDRPSSGVAVPPVPPAPPGPPDAPVPSEAPGAKEPSDTFGL